MNTRYIYSIILLLFAVAMQAQTIKVLDKSDLQPIEGVTITNQAKTVLVSTGASGTADISGFSANEELFFNHVAFQPVIISKTDLQLKNNTVYLTEDVIRLDEFIVSANKTQEKRSDVPNKIEVIQAKDIQFNNPPTAAIMLEQTGDVFVQQSQLGGGSPILRGFEANRVLLVVDGVRMNNAIYRAGHLQNSITVDPQLLSSTEVLYGPGSVIYGSDALGGVINFVTTDPVLSGTKKFLVKGNVLARFASADLEKTGGFNVSLGWKKFAFLTSFSYSSFSDLREGRVTNPAYGDWGKCLFYAERINNKDSMMVNNKPWIQKRSGYSQYNIMEKVMFQPDMDQKYTLNFQYSNSSNINRYDRLSEMDGSTGKLKYADWYYGPQQRLFISLKADIAKNGVIFDKFTVTAAYQNIREDRINRKFGNNKTSFNNEQVGFFTLNADFLKALGKKDDLRYGFEVTYNNVKSTAHKENIVSGAITHDIATRYPDKNANMTSAAAYLSNIWKINKVLNFSQGIRYSYIMLNAAWSDSMMAFMKFPFASSFSQKHGAFNGYLGLVANLPHDWRFSVVGSSGFRAADIDDITKVNDSNSQDNLIIVPNPGLKPEYAYNVDLSIGKTIENCVRLEATGFYTWLTDAIVLGPFTYNGQDSIVYNGSKSQVQANINSGGARIYGVQASLLAQVTRSFSILSNLTYTVGQLNDNTPLDHIPPVYGMTSFNLELKKFKGSFYVNYNGWKRMSQYSGSGEDNEVYATQWGSPAWYTLNLKASYQINRYLNVEAGVENIMDEQYRKFASGISSPGRNVIVALRASL
ncbi:MAG: TonB-dependent receptor [Bacteroidota bacterium]